MAKKKATRKATRKATKATKATKARKATSTKAANRARIAGQQLVERETEALLGEFADYNPNRMSDHDFERLKSSISKFGFVEPVVWNRKTKTVVGGHHRIAAACEIGLKYAPVLVINVTPEEERVLNVALNRISGEFDQKKLAELLQDLERDQGGAELLEYTGLEDFELDPLLAAEWDAEGKRVAASVGNDAPSKHSIVFGPEEWPAVVAAIDLVRKVEGDEKYPKAKAIAAIARAYETSCELGKGA